MKIFSQQGVTAYSLL